MSQMAREAAETADGARRQVARCARAFDQLGERLRDQPPPFVVTCARGSSDHAATYGKYLIETTVGRLVASVGPGVASAYGRVPQGIGGALCIAISQSGKSPDLLELASAARMGGALLVAMVNDETSPLAGLADITIPLCAGQEKSVAATKSFLLAGFACLQLAAAWTGDPALADAVARAPDAFEAAAQLDWSPALISLAKAHGLYVVGRGIGLGAAAELALKLKETCGLHAEAFSTAEVMHGPLALVGPGFPLLALGQHDETEASLRDAIAKLVATGAPVHSVLEVAGTEPLPTVPKLPAVLEPLAQIQAFYMAAPVLAAARGIDPDAPPHLRKVTETR
jgi:glucosamine--fructose-6-phosphate aminotransferase (isomerizing)